MNASYTAGKLVARLLLYAFLAFLAFTVVQRKRQIYMNVAAGF
jgi:hypothetical protein